MASEVEHIERDGAALRWALGCVFASYSERIKAMPGVKILLGAVPPSLVIAAVAPIVDLFRGHDVGYAFRLWPYTPLMVFAVLVTWRLIASRINRKKS